MRSGETRGNDTCGKREPSSSRSIGNSTSIDKISTIDSTLRTLCLHTQVHAVWRTGLFEIRPLEYYDGMRRLGIEVYWQTNQGHTIDDDDVLVTKRPISSINLSEYP
jgi:hypothetical protein